MPDVLRRPNRNHAAKNIPATRNATAAAMATGGWLATRTALAPLSACGVANPGAAMPSSQDIVGAADLAVLGFDVAAAVGRGVTLGVGAAVGLGVRVGALGLGAAVGRGVGVGFGLWVGFGGGASNAVRSSPPTSSVAAAGELKPAASASATASDAMQAFSFVDIDRPRETMAAGGDRVGHPSVPPRPVRADAVLRRAGDSA